MQDSNGPIRQRQGFRSLSLEIVGDDDIDLFGQVVGIVEIPGDQVAIVDLFVAEVENVFRGNRQAAL